MISDNLAGLFAPSQQGLLQSFSVCMGTMLSFNSSSGSNTVGIIGGAILTDVPVLETGTEVSLSPGDAVVLARIGYSYLILGKVALPGSSNYGRASVSTASLNVFSKGFNATNVDLTVATGTFQAPSWANTVSLNGTFFASVKNSSGVDCDYQCYMILDGANQLTLGIGGDAYGHNGSFCQTMSNFSTTHTITPGSVLTCEGHFAPSAACGTTAGNLAVLSVSAVFTKS